MGRFFKWFLGILFSLIAIGVITDNLRQEFIVKPQAQKAREARAASRTGAWTIERGRSSFDDSPTVTLQLEAVKPISGWPGKIEIPVLILRCQEHKTEVYIRTGMAPTVEYGRFREATVRVRLDDDPATKKLASLSTDSHALFFREPIALIRSLLKHEQMRFGFTPFNSPAAETSFDLDGLNEAIKPLREACHWD